MTELVTADRSAAVRTVRSWPLLVLAAPAAAEVWSGWVGLGQKTGFGLVRPLPGIWPSLHLDTTFTLPVGVEAYAAYALRAWLSSRDTVSPQTRRFAKWSALFSFAIGMAGQVTYHLLAQAGAARAPWGITIVVSCLPVLVLAMGTALAHMLRADASTVDRSVAVADGTPDVAVRGPARDRSQGWSARDQGSDQSAGGTGPDGPADHDARSAGRNQGHQDGRPVTPGVHAEAGIQPRQEEVQMTVRRLVAAGIPVSRRTLRVNGVRGSNAWLGTVARAVNAELTVMTVADHAGPPG